MSVLRQRMLEDLSIRNYASRTKERYIACVAQFARHFHKSPDLQASSGAAKRRRHPERLLWSVLLRRVFLHEILRCPCGGKRRVLAMVFNRESIRRVLKHMALPEEAPARSPPRGVAVGLPF